MEGICHAHSHNQDAHILTLKTVAQPQVSRKGYLAASSASAYSLISMVQRFGPHMNEGGSVISLTYLASQQVIPGAWCVCVCHVRAARILHCADAEVIGVVGEYS